MKKIIIMGWSTNVLGMSIGLGQRRLYIVKIIIYLCFGNDGVNGGPMYINTILIFLSTQYIHQYLTIPGIGEILFPIPYLSVHLTIFPCVRKIA